MGKSVAQDFETLGAKISGLVGQPRGIAAGPREGSNEAGTNRIARHRKHNWDSRSRLLRSERRFVSARENEIDLKADEFSRDLGEALRNSLCRAILDGYGTPFDPAEFAQTAHKRLDPCALACRRAGIEQADGQKLAGPLLRASRDRPRRRAAEERDEFAAPNHSITSVASASSVGGTVRPSTFAVVRLMTRSNLVGCSTGMSAGFAPRNILSTNSAARRYKSGKFVP